MTPRARAREAPDFVEQLRFELAAHLKHVETEARAVRRALRALDGPEQQATRARSLRLRVTDELAHGPHLRASVLALALGADVAAVRHELESLANEGLIRRDGLVWRLA